MDVDDFKLKWDYHKSDIINQQQYLFENDLECDCTLISAQGKVFRAHKMVLSSSSDFFHTILADANSSIEPTILIPDAEDLVLEALIKFIYTGTTSIGSKYLSSLLEFCNILSIKGFVANTCSLNGISMSTGGESPIIDNHPKKVKYAKNLSVDQWQEEEYLVDVDSMTTQSDIIDQSEGDPATFDIEYLDMEDESITVVKNEQMYLSVEDDVQEESQSIIDDSNCITFNVEKASEEENDSEIKSSTPHAAAASQTKHKRNQIDEALNELNQGKTIHQLSVEYNLPRSTLYHRFRNNADLQENYRSERKNSLEQAVRSVLVEHVSLKQASIRFNVPKTAIWRQVRTYKEYQPIKTEVTAERKKAQQEILMGKSLSSISAKYRIPMTTLHRDKKKLSQEGKLPEHFRVRDRTENSEYGKRLEAALQKCKQGMTQYQAAKLFNIPKATMWRYAHALLKDNNEKPNK